MHQYYLGFSLFPGIGPKKFAKLLGTFGSAKSAWEADKVSLAEVLGIPLAEKFVDFKKTFSFDHELSKLSLLNVSILTPEDTAYPQLLKKLPSHPFVLYVKGRIEILNVPKAIGIVGTRKISGYGREVTQTLTRELVDAGFVTVSGLAFGVDATVHTTTIEQGGQTIAVLGCGVDCCSPKENKKIYDSILDSGGAVVSTFKISEQATPGTFPARNAIIAGLSLGVLVTEGTADSGALITAEYAKKFDRSVFAVPGPITSHLSKGANALIREGALAVDTVSDILQVLHVDKKGEKIVKTIQNLTSEERKILDMIQLCPLHFDEIVRTIGKPTQEVGTILSMMELKGLIRNSSSIYSLIK